MLLRPVATFWATFLMNRALGDEFSSVEKGINGIFHYSKSRTAKLTWDDPAINRRGNGF